MNKPSVSVIISTYNDSRYITQCLSSVFSQDYPNFEVILIDDASTDQTVDIVMKFKIKHSNLRLIKNKKNVGLTKNLNYGISISRSKYIARIDGDDFWNTPNKLSCQINFLESNSDYALVGTLANAVDEDGKKLFAIHYPLKDCDIKRIFLIHSPFVHSSIVFRRNVALNLGLYNENYMYAQDYDLYLKLGLNYKVFNIKKPMVSYRINPGGTSRKKYDVQMDTMIKIIQNYRSEYSGYYMGWIMWRLRKYYPVWFRGSVSRNIKSFFKKI